MRWVDRILKPLGLERRADPSWAGATGGLSGAGALTFGAGVGVNPILAENLSGVFASVNAIASALATAPALIYRVAGGTRTEVLDHPVKRLIDRGPNPHMTWPGLVEAMAADTLLAGNSLVEIEREGGGIAGLRFIPWRHVTASLGPSGRLIYDVSEPGFMGSTGRQRRLLADDGVHLKDRSDDGYLGRSRLSRAAGAFTSALNGEEYYRSFLRNGANPSGALETDGDLSQEQLASLRNDVDRIYSGLGNVGRVILLTGGVKYRPITISPEDAELLASRKFALEEIARIFAVPPPMIGDLSHGTFTNSREAARWFAQFTLAPWARKIEAAFTQALFPEGSGLSLELDLSGLLRGDPETRWASHKIAVEAGILDADEVREIEGFNPRGGAQ